MPAEVQIPTLGESLTEGVIVRWIKTDGESVQSDDPLFELETDKATVEIPAPDSGIIRILVPEGSTVQVGDVVARIEAGAADGKESAKPASGEPDPPASDTASPPSGAQPDDAQQTTTPTAPPTENLSPAVRRLVLQHELDPTDIAGTGRGGRLTKADVLAHIDSTPSSPAVETKPAPPLSKPAPTPPSPRRTDTETIERVPMTRLRQRIAERLREAQRTAAILTTFNEVDMSATIELRKQYKERFAEAHGVSLGFMSFFARACTAALQDMPLINAQIDGTDIVYNKRVHLGVAVGTERGLVVPILHDADGLSFADIERGIARLAGLARDNKLGIDDLSGGTFTISNGGVYGSLLSTPILNPPQSAILGMHKIEKRPVVVDDQVVVRPMMYLALSYDHRLIDGADAVTFLVKVKDRIEDPARLLFDL
jgi:2-oxoglutarate dehydrogenase E2 component (dihydrolipoamide succinyltransferase)